MSHNSTLTASQRGRSSRSTRLERLPNMAQNSEPILFVAMDGTGVKSSVIRAHAARKGHQRSRQRLEKAAVGSKSGKQEKQSSGSPDATTKIKVRREASTRSTKPPPLLKSASKSSSNSEKKTEVEQTDVQPQQQIVPARRHSQSSLQTWLPSFESEKYISMFFETMMDSYTAAYTAFNVPNIIKQEWPLYMNHEVFLYTEAAAIQGLYDSLQNPTKPPSITVLKYKAKALQSLKKELMATRNGQLDDYLVMSIFVLASLDLMAGDSIAHNAHKQILRTAFSAAGGLHNYGSFVRNTTMRLDSFWRSTPDEPTTPAVPLLAPSRAPQLPSHPFSPEICDLIATLPPGFCELAIQRKLPLDVLEILGRIADPNQKPLPSLSPTINDNRSPKTSCGMYLDFWESCPSLSVTTSSNGNGEPPLERLLSLALLIYATNRDATNPLRMYNCITNGAIYDLAHDLPLCEARRPKNEEHCLFWIWTVAVDANRDRFGVLTGPGEVLLEQQRRRFPGIVGTNLEEQFLRLFWFASSSGSGSCLFEAHGHGHGQSVRGKPAPLRRGSTYVSNASGGTSSPGASWGRSDSWESHGAATPRLEAEQSFECVGSNASLDGDSESVAASQWSGPGFGLLPSGKMVEKVPELSYGKIGSVKQGTIKCVAG